MEDFCLDYDGHVEWPRGRFLDRFSEAIRRSASLYFRGGQTIWSCVEAIENRRPSLDLRQRIEDLVKRARKLYLPEPRAIQIRKQALDGNEASKRCFEALRECYEGKSRFTSINWKEHGAILAPRPAESYEARAAQICIDWLRWALKVDGPATPLVFWLMRIGNSDLLRTLGYSRSLDFFDRIRVERRETKLKQGNVIRQKWSRLRKDRLALSRSLRSERRGLHELVRQELKIIDSSETSEDARNAAAGQLAHYTHRTPEEWRRFFFRKA